MSQRCKNCYWWAKEHPTVSGWRLCAGKGAEPEGWYITGDARECDVFIDREKYISYLEAKMDYLKWRKKYESH